jgi:hypothetical protein
MKKLINSLIVVASITFASIANAGLITLDETNIDIQDTRTNGDYFSFAYDNGTIDYWFKDNFMLIDFNLDSLTYVGLPYGDFELSIANIYLESDTVTQSYSNQINLFNLFDKDITKVGFELLGGLEFITTGFGSETTATSMFYDGWSSSSNYELANVTFQESNGKVDVPEPSSLAIFGLAMIGLIGSSLRKRKSSILS